MKKIKSSISRNLILSFVLLVTIIFAILAWFSSVEEAKASGLSVISTSSNGLQVAFEDVDEKYSDHLVDDLDDSIKKYPLITGNGTITTDGGVNLMIPLLNRSTGEAITPYESKRDLVANQDYYEADLYFRDDEPLEISLSAGSNIVPKDVANNTLDNKSLYGAFSKDYIAGAARVAFYNVDTEGNESLKKIWIPNKNYELIESSQFTKIEKVSSGGSGFNTNPDITFGLTDTSKYTKVDQYLWEGHANSSSDKGELLKIPQHRKMYKDNENDNILYGAVDLSSNNNINHYIDINDSDSIDIFTNGYNSSVQGQKNDTILTLNNVVINDVKICDWVEVYVDNSFNIYDKENTKGGDIATGIDSVTWRQLNVNTNNNSSFFNIVNRFQVLLSYDTSNKKVKVEGFVFYNSDNPEVALGGTGDYGTGSKNYVLKDGSTVVITGTENGVSKALSFVNNNPRAYELGTISNQMKLYNSNCMFVVENNGNDTYYLKHLPTGKYFVLDNNGFLTLSETPSTFVLSSESNNPVLMCNNFYLAFENGVFFGTKIKDKAVINIYEGSTYSFKENGGAEQEYYYLTAKESSQTVLPSNLYFTEISQCPVLATLETLDNSGYYKAHIKVRIWVEGTDREAKNPLAGGIFNNILKFTGTKIEEN